MTKYVESAAYHEAGHMTAAVVQAMPIRPTGLHVDSCGCGCADYFQRVLGDTGNTVLDQIERKRTIIALYAAHVAQRRFYPEIGNGGWLSDFLRIQGLVNEMELDAEQARLLKEDLYARATKLVDKFWPIIEQLAKALLSKHCMPRLPAETWGSGASKRNMSGFEVAELFARHCIGVKVVGDDVRNSASSQDAPYHDSLA